MKAGCLGCLRVKVRNWGCFPLTHHFRADFDHGKIMRPGESFGTKAGRDTGQSVRVCRFKEASGCSLIPGIIYCNESQLCACRLACRIGHLLCFGTTFFKPLGVVSWRVDSANIAARMVASRYLRYAPTSWLTKCVGHVWVFSNTRLARLRGLQPVGCCQIRGSHCQGIKPTVELRRLGSYQTSLSKPS